MHRVVTPGLLLVLGCVGCGAGTANSNPETAASKPTAVFPSRDEIAAIPSQAPHREAFGGDEVQVDSWGFEAQVERDSAAYEDTSVWGGLLREMAARHDSSVTPSAPLKCAAQEFARFHAKNGAMPTESLRRFTAARCGAITTGIAPVFWSVTTPSPLSDEELASKVRTTFGKVIGLEFAGGHHQVGLAAAREGQRTSVVLAIAKDEARLEPTSLEVEDNRRIALKGAVRGQYSAIAAMINRGDGGVALCKADPQVRPPRFAVTCDLAPGDRFAWVEIVGRRPGELLLHDVAETIVHEGDGSAVTYARRVRAPNRVANAGALTRAILDGLNRARATARMAPLKLAEKQSAENARLAGTLIDASIGGDDGTSNRAAIGLLAGWDVPAIIRNGAFFLSALRTTDASAWLDFALEHPMGRFSLLDPDARFIAIGPAMPGEGGALGAAVTTYSLFESDDHGADAARFFARVAAARAASGLPAPVRIKGPAEMDAELARVRKAGAGPMDALQTTMQLAAERTGRGVHGYVLETNDLNQVEVPAALLRGGPLHTIVGVTHHRADGAAWGQYVVVVLVLGDEMGGA